MVRERLRRLGDDPLVSAVSVHEVVRGMRDGEEERTFTFLDALPVVAVGREEARISAEWRRAYASRGVTLGMPDTLIAACALTSRVPLATANVRHFPMAEIEVQDWASG